MIDPGYLKIGPHEFGEGTPLRCTAKVTATATAKLDKKAADGKKDAITTAKGREPADLSVELSWVRKRFDPESEKNHQRIKAALKFLNPRGPNSGKAFEWVHEDADVYDGSSIKIEKLEGPSNAPGTNSYSAKISGATSNRIKDAPVNSSDAVDGSKWTVKKNVVNDFGGIPGNKITFPSPPVKP